MNEYESRTISAIPTISGRMAKLNNQIDINQFMNDTSTIGHVRGRIWWLSLVQSRHGCEGCAQRTVQLGGVLQIQDDSAHAITRKEGGYD